jgi:hemoglobin
MLFAAVAVASPIASACARQADPAQQADKQAQPAAGTSLYDRLGGIFAIASVVNYFSDEIIKDPVAGAKSKNPALREWHTKQLGRLPGLKFMRTLWVAAVSGGPYQYTPTKPGSTNLGLEAAHKDLKISSLEFDAVAGVLSRTLDQFSVPEKEKSEVLAAFALHKDEVTRGSREALKGA